MELIDELAQTGRNLFKELPTTLEVCRAFGDLGLSKGYFVACSAYRSFLKSQNMTNALDKVDGEWLYDLCWYRSPNGVFQKLPVVLESELHISLKRYKENYVDGDFGKLVQARTEVRIWVTQVNTTSLVQNHIDSCMRDAREFEYSVKGDKYLFIVFDWLRKKTEVQIHTI